MYKLFLLLLLCSQIHTMKKSPKWIDEDFKKARNLFKLHKKIKSIKEEESKKKYLKDQIKRKDFNERQDYI